MGPEPLRFQTFEVGELRTNAYVVYAPGSRTCVVVDPGDEAARLIRFIDDENLKPAGIILTHGHLDHCGAAAALVARYRAPLMVHSADRPMLASELNGEFSDMLGIPLPPPPDRLLGDGEIVTISADLALTVIHTPGHTPGSVCLRINDWLFSGDTLFRGDIGRTDLPGGSDREILLSLKRLRDLPKTMVLLPGHGPASTLAEELANNPYWET